jgi:hypothetical protein
VGNFVVAGSFRCITENFEWAFSSLYCLNDDVEGRCLWDELVEELVGDVVVYWGVF